MNVSAWQETRRSVGRWGAVWVAEGRRRISRRSQSHAAIAAPPLLMKPSLSNADECLLVKEVGGGWWATLGLLLLLLFFFFIFLFLSLPAALRRLSATASTHF